MILILPIHVFCAFIREFRRDDMTAAIGGWPRYILNPRRYLEFYFQREPRRRVAKRLHRPTIANKISVIFRSFKRDRGGGGSGG